MANGAAGRYLPPAERYTTYCSNYPKRMTQEAPSSQLPTSSSQFSASNAIPCIPSSDTTPARATAAEASVSPPLGGPRLHYEIAACGGNPDLAASAVSAGLVGFVGASCLRLRLLL